MASINPAAKAAGTAAGTENARPEIPDGRLSLETFNLKLPTYLPLTSGHPPPGRYGNAANKHHQASWCNLC